MLKKLIGILVALIVLLGGYLFANRKTVQGVLPAIKPVVIGQPEVNIKELKLEEWVTGLENPRDMEFDSKKRLLVSIPARGEVVTITHGQTEVILKGLNQPHGLAFLNGKLYVAETNRVKEYTYDLNVGHASNGVEVSSLPSGKGHFTRSLTAWRGKLLIAVGSACNVCREDDQRRAKILIYDPVTQKTTEFAKGLRNSVFLTVKPKTEEVWATDMGRDWLGDDLPPDEVNIIVAGGNYGWPYCFGKNVHDDDFDVRKAVNCKEPEYTPSLIDLPAHSAPLGLAFIPESWGKRWAGSLLVAYHGSWNRTEPTGYKVVVLKLDKQGTYLGSEDVFDFRNEQGEVVGRPADVIFDDDGNLYISDDKAGKIYLAR